VEIAINALLTVVGLAMLCFGGNWLVSGGVSIAKKLRISQMVIGLTVVAYGTSTPELAASVVASLGSHTDLILGNIVGSNISNIGMVIGISAIISPLVVSKATTRKEVPIMIGVMLLLVAMSIDGEISQYDGVLLIAGLIAFTVYTVSRAKKERKQKDEGTPAQKSSMPKAVGLVAIGSGLLYLGGYLTIENVVSIAQSIGVSETVVGITIVAIGTSLPELITSLIAIKKGHTDIGIGNIVGSNIYNVLMIMGVASLITGIAVVPEIFTDYIIMIGFAVVLIAFLRSGIIPRPAGVGLAIAYAVYLGYTLLS
jgi:cation:H+ antiporter